MRPNKRRNQYLRLSWRSGALIGAAATVVLLASACAGPSSPAGGGASKGQSIVIGSLQPLTGNDQFLGDDTMNGVNLAVQQINAQGGIKSLGGAKLTVKSVDSSSADPSSATAAASQLLSSSPSAVIAPTDSTVVLPASSVFERAGVPQCTSSFTDAITSRGYKTVFQLPTTATEVGQASADSLTTILPQLGSGFRKVAVLFDATNPAGADQVAPIEADLKQHGFQIVYSKGFQEGLASAAPLATAIKASGAQVLVDGAITPSDALLINKALQVQGVNLPKILPGGGVATTSSYLTSLGSLVNGSFTTMQWNYSMNLSSSQNSLLDQAESQYVSQKMGPFMDQFAGEAYVCTWLFADAMEKAKSSSPSAIVTALHSDSFTSTPGSLFPSGSVQFDSKGLDAKAVNLVGEWCHNKLQTVYPAKYARAKITPPAQCS